MKKLSLTRIIVLLFAVCSVLFAVSCKTDYTEKAAEKARKYALKNLKGVNAETRDFIKYTKPVVYENLLIPQYVMPISDIGHLKIDQQENFPTAPHLDKMHSCFVWEPPGLGSKVVVVGEGERSMRFWTPVRVLIKDYKAPDMPFRNACSAAAEYALSSMVFLSPDEITRVRFSVPEVVYTKYVIEEDNDEILDTKSSWESYLESYLAPKPSKTQISLVWKGDEADHVVIISGTSTTGDLYDWKPTTGQIDTRSRLAEFTLSEKEKSKIVITSPARVQMMKPDAQFVNRDQNDVAPKKSFLEQNLGDDGGHYHYSR